MTYFVELYDRHLNHVGTRSLRATDAMAARGEAEAIRQTTGYTVHLFEQPPFANYALLTIHA
jgi:hypothetical protein